MYQSMYLLFMDMGIGFIDQFPHTEKIGSVCHERFIPETIFMRG